MIVCVQVRADHIKLAHNLPDITVLKGQKPSETTPTFMLDLFFAVNACDLFTHQIKCEKQHSFPSAAT